MLCVHLCPRWALFIYFEKNCEEVYEKDVNRVIGLIANPNKLISIREERLKSLGLASGAKYANIDRIKDEIDYSKQVMDELGCFVIDVSHKAIEETAEIIIERLKKLELR